MTWGWVHDENFSFLGELLLYASWRWLTENSSSQKPVTFFFSVFFRLVPCAWKEEEQEMRWELSVVMRKTEELNNSKCLLLCPCATGIRDTGILCNIKRDTDGTRTTGICEVKQWKTIETTDQRHDEWRLASQFILKGFGFTLKPLMWYGRALVFYTMEEITANSPENKPHMVHVEVKSVMSENFVLWLKFSGHIRSQCISIHVFGVENQVRIQLFILLARFWLIVSSLHSHVYVNKMEKGQIWNLNSIWHIILYTWFYNNVYY